MFKKIRLKWKYKWKYLPHDIKVGLKNLIKWFKIIWKDRDYDHYFLFEMIKYKLLFMQDYHASRKFYVGWENNVKWMQICIRLIDKIQNGTYKIEYQNYVESEFTFNPIEGSDNKLLGIKILEENLDDYFKIYKREFEKIKKDNPQLDLNKPEGKKYLALLLGLNISEKSKRLLFDILNWKIKDFWD